jgi:HAD superfamily hydrolase (TIGR01509 family)
MKDLLSKINCAILDLDGTILDSMEDWKNVTRDYLSSLGIQAEPDIREQVKRRTSKETAIYLQNHYGVSKSTSEIISGLHHVIRTKYETSIPLKPSGIEILRILKKYNIPFCAATSTEKDMVSAALKRLGIYDDFTFILTCSEVGKGKDFPDIYLASMERLGGTLENTIVFEDALHCIKTAKNAGFTVVGVYEEVDAQDWKEICQICDARIK